MISEKIWGGVWVRSGNNKEGLDREYTIRGWGPDEMLKKRGITIFRLMIVRLAYHS